MKDLIIPEGYKSVLTLRETQRAIKYVKDIFERSLAERLNLERITAPLFVTKRSGINDDLNGVERKVEFNVREAEEDCEIVQSLAKWKRMALYRYGFSAGEGLYTDMNAIRLKLYKRERMKEQSRYLRYEEAVGSTGQSQGIYIQFLVSIINYISGMYAPEAEASELKKVIFIDNPFGAAKDIYIWEPIFELLKTNNVQLIVPARGATPAITNRFDVNYILGQQLVGGRQQTVVVDYRSQVAQEELEYENLEYSQATFDFI